MSITVSLLGTPCVMMDGKMVIFPYRKVEGFFYYLCVRRSVSRDEVIGIFWADCPEVSARKNLRDAIYNLKKLLGEEVISIEGNNRVTLRRDRVTRIDYEELNESNLLERYTGDFLGYFYIKNCLEFEDWATEIREELLRRYQIAISERVMRLVHGNEINPLVDCGLTLLRKHIFDEAFYREILNRLLQLGGYTEAEQLYQRLTAQLMEELSAEPEDKTVQLMQEANTIRMDRELKLPEHTVREYFFGREQEMNILFSKLRSFKSGERTSSVLLTGEAGVGKSAILRRVQETAQAGEYIVLSYQCVQTEEELYLKPWNDILAQLEECHRKFHIPVNSIPSLYEQQIDTSLFATQYELLIETMFQELSQSPAIPKLVLFIDDIQWMDKASKRLLCNLLFWARNEKVLAILTSRDENMDQLLKLKAPLIAKGLLRELIISRFTLAETKEIISQRRPELLDKQGMVEKIYHSTDGNALFLVELLKELEHGGSAGQLSQRTTSMIQGRLMDLSREERDLLDNISLYPRFATIEELQMLSGRLKMEILKHLERLLSRQLICLNETRTKRGYGFSHQMIRDYIYDSLLEDKRMALHTLAAEYYEREYLETADVSLCSMLIYHFSRCQDTYKVYTYRLEYLRAFYAVQHEIYPTVLTTQNETEFQMPQLDGEDELVSLAEQIRALHRRDSEIDSLRMKVEFLIGRYDLFSGSYEKGLKNVQMSIQLAKKLNDSKYLMENYLQMVFHAIQIHDLKMLGEYITACEELLNRYSYTKAEAYTIKRLRGVYYMKRYQYGKAKETFDSIIRRIEPLAQVDASYRVGLAACYNYLGESQQAMNLLDEALEYYLRAIRCCEGENMVSGMGVFYSNAGYIFLRRGELEQAQVYIDKANLCFAERGAMWGRSRARSYAALLAIQRGDWAEAEKHYKIAKDTAIRGGNPSALALANEVERRLKAHQQPQEPEGKPSI